MAEVGATQPELADIFAILADKFKNDIFAKWLYHWERIVFSLIIIAVLSLIAYLAGRKSKFIPGRLQNAVEAVVAGVDDFVCGLLGPKGRRYTPFIGTLFIYILFMNLSGIIPFMKPSTSSWSTTIALALCVFIYVQYAAIREKGFLGYLDHLAGKPRGIMAAIFVLPLLMFFLHLLAELIRPISLSLRLRSNIWGDDLLLAVLAGFGLKGLPLLLLNMLMGILTAVVQTVVFCLLSTIYFTLALTTEEEHT
jgi:F-type H+-transporting ATPase subunit a